MAKEIPRVQNLILPISESLFGAPNFFHKPTWPAPRHRQSKDLRTHSTHRHVEPSRLWIRESSAVLGSLKTCWKNYPTDVGWIEVVYIYIAKPIMKYAYFSKKPGSLILPLWFWTQDASPTHHTGGRTVEGSRPGDRYMISHGMPEWNWRTWDVTWSTWSWVKSVKGDNRCWISTLVKNLNKIKLFYPETSLLTEFVFSWSDSHFKRSLLSALCCRIASSSKRAYFPNSKALLNIPPSIALVKQSASIAWLLTHLSLQFSDSLSLMSKHSKVVLNSSQVGVDVFVERS